MGFFLTALIFFSSVLGGLNSYIFLLFFVSIYKQTQRPSQIRTSLPPKSSIKVLFSSPPSTRRGEKRVVSSLSRLSENPGEITLSAAAVQQRVITNSNGCFYINGRLWRPLNEQIAGVKHLWKCHLRKRKRRGEGEGEGARRGEARGGGGEGCFWSWQISAGQCWATVYLGPAIVFWELAVQGSVWISRVRCWALWTNLHQDSIPTAARWSMSVRFERLAYVMKARLRYKERGERTNEGLRRTKRTAELNIESKNKRRQCEGGGGEKNRRGDDAK